MLYSIKYKKPNGWFWRKIRKIEGDATLVVSNKETGINHSFSVRVFFLKDKSRVEIPMSWAVKFSKERFYDIKEKMEDEAGQPMRLRKN